MTPEIIELSVPRLEDREISATRSEESYCHTGTPNQHIRATRSSRFHLQSNKCNVNEMLKTDRANLQSNAFLPMSGIVAALEVIVFVVECRLCVLRLARIWATRVFESFPVLEALTQCSRKRYVPSGKEEPFMKALGSYLLIPRTEAGYPE